MDGSWKSPEMDVTGGTHSWETIEVAGWDTFALRNFWTADSLASANLENQHVS